MKQTVVLNFYRKTEQNIHTMIKLHFFLFAPGLDTISRDRKCYRVGSRISSWLTHRNRNLVTKGRVAGTATAFRYFFLRSFGIGASGAGYKYWDKVACLSIPICYFKPVVTLHRETWLSTSSAQVLHSWCYCYFSTEQIQLKNREHVLRRAVVFVSLNVNRMIFVLEKKNAVIMVAATHAKDQKSRNVQN